MGPMMRSFAACFKTTDGLIPLVAGDLSNEQATWQSRDRQGPSISWIMLHLLHYRHSIMKLLGAERPDPYKEIGTQTASDGKNYPPIEDLVTQWNQVQGQLHQVLEGVTDEDLQKPMPSGPHGERKVLDTIAFLTWHEAYHLGALGQLRKEQGLPGPAEKVLAAMEAGAKARGA